MKSVSAMSPSLLDLSYPLRADMAVYPGTPPVVLKPLCTIERDGFAENRLEISSHTGTHIDAPAHMLSGGRTLDSYPLSFFEGRALVIDCSSLPGSRIALSDLLPFSTGIKGVDFVLLSTGWARFWGHERYFHDYPVLHEDAARWLSGFTLRGIGVDAVSVDAPDAENFPIHHILLEAGLLLIENLVSLSSLAGCSFRFTCLPLPIESAEAAPVRAVAYL